MPEFSRPETEKLEKIAGALRRGETPPGSRLLKENPVRRVVSLDDVVLKVFLRPSRTPQREARTLKKARALGVPVPEFLAAGEDWIATRRIEARSATRQDLSRILPVVNHMHASGMLHCDLHLGNFLVSGDDAVLLDTQRSRFFPHLPGWLRRWELGRLAYSLGEPVPDEMGRVHFWRELRARQHWRSRTRRCTKESSRFTRFHLEGKSGFRLREVPEEDLVRTLAKLDRAEVIWPTGQLYRAGSWVVKRHASERAARSAWIAGHGLEVRGVRTARAIAWLGDYLIMEDAGETVVKWSQSAFARSSSQDQEAMMHALADLMANLHRRGIYHFDTKACNVTWMPGQSPRLLDYERVRFGLWVSTRRRTKNLAQLNAALPDVVPGSLRERGLKRYVERSAFRGDVAKLRDEVISISLRRGHRWHGCSASKSTNSPTSPTHPS